MKIMELFSGIGGFTKGFIDAGYQIEEHFFSEIDKHAIANYKYNFPNAKYIGSVTDISGRDFTGIDIITFGSPCQDFSLAGKREGMDGKRSVLILEAIRLVTELRPSVFIWENVKGAFSSNAGADFWAILQAFANIGGYRLEWQLLNTKWFLPQNRERIYLVGHLDGRSKPGVFPIGEREGLCNERNQNEKAVYASTLKATSVMNWAGDFIKVRSANKEGFEIAKPGDSINIQNLNSSTGKSVASTLDNGCKQAVVQLNNSKESGGVHAVEGISPTLDQSAGRWQIGTWRDFKGEIGLREMDNNLCPTLLARARSDGSGQPVIQNEASIRRLTEIECERLQGFPDNWTENGNYDGTIKKIPKTQRYKMLGNAVTVRVVEEIAKRIELL
ncbi:DNA cytosine methyltransferase [Chryseobacterium aquifrigidense]|uniref:Cytosine-specific methyltransferase n=1 Tax=Chryseobacterium aquifrigidense TaxID=558021 RepID=A0A543E9M7_9FLAO|nr:DNA (cytosine-5-)-methyltransferase [Chryseobacterium aquifrigidense]TQM18314.1 DNA (cytosine-5)-methyltransferase 1 [Chryseobacterium aquifrigidense]